MAERLAPLEGAAAPTRRNGELAFDAPWQSRLFALTAALVEREVFGWPEVQQALIAAIAAREGDAARGVCAPADLAARAAELARRPAGHDHG